MHVLGYAMTNGVKAISAIWSLVSEQKFWLPPKSSTPPVTSLTTVEYTLHYGASSIFSTGTSKDLYNKFESMEHPAN